MNEIRKMKREEICQELLKSVEKTQLRDLLINEKLSFTPAVPIIPLEIKQANNTTDNMFIHLEIDQLMIGTALNESLESIEHNAGGQFKQSILKNNYHSIESMSVFYGILSWFIQLSVYGVEIDYFQTAITLKTIGLIQTASLGCEGANQLEKPRIKCLLQANLCHLKDNKVSLDDLKSIISRKCSEQINQWKDYNNWIYNPEGIRLPKLNVPISLNIFNIQFNLSNFWFQTQHQTQPNSYIGKIQHDNTIWNTEPKKDQDTDENNIFNNEYEQWIRNIHHLLKQNYCCFKSHSIYASNIEEYCTTITEINLSQLQLNIIGQFVYSLLISFHLRNLYTSGIRIAWLSSKNRNNNDSNEGDNNLKPYLVLAIRGIESHTEIQHILNWFTSKKSILLSTSVQVYGSCYEDVNKEHIIHWFGPRLTHPSTLNYIKTFKDNLSILNNNQNEHWVIEYQATSLFLLLSSQCYQLIPKLIELLTLNYGYKLVDLKYWNSVQCSNDVNLHDLKRYFNDLIISQQFLWINQFKLNTTTTTATSTGEISSQLICKNYYLIIIKHENALQHLQCLKEQIKVFIHRQNSIIHSLKDNPETVFIHLQFLDSQTVNIFTLNNLNYLPISNTEENVTSQGQLNLSTNKNPAYPDCESLSFILCIPCLNVVPQNETGHHSNEINKSLHPILHFTNLLQYLIDFNETNQSSINIISMKWISLRQLNDIHRKLINDLLYLNNTHKSVQQCLNLFDALSLNQHNSSDDQCSVGCVLIHGENLLHCLTKWFNSNQIYFTLDLSSVKKLSEIFFNSTELCTYFDYTTRCQINNELSTLPDKDQFEHVWNEIMNSLMNLKWCLKECCLQINYHHHSEKFISPSDWLKNLCQILKILLSEGFNITNLYTTKTNEACLSVSRVNAVNRLRQMNWITDEILSMHKTPLQLLKELIHIQRSKLQQSDEFHLSEIPLNDEAVQSELAKFHERLSQLIQDNIDSIKQFNENTTIEIYNDLTDTWSTVKSNQMNLIIIRYDEYNTTGEAISSTDDNIRRNKHQILLNILNKIRKHEFNLAALYLGYVDKVHMSLFDKVQLKNCQNDKPIDQLVPIQSFLLPICRITNE
ncbi:unnamed protein product [Trichobilharzia szidati]|nr:unnamed protein product [Trichobilharzia szidati]